MLAGFYAVRGNSSEAVLTKLIGKHLCWSRFFKERAVNLLKTLRGTSDFRGTLP